MGFIFRHLSWFQHRDIFLRSFSKCLHRFRAIFVSEFLHVPIKLKAMQLTPSFD